MGITGNCRSEAARRFCARSPQFDRWSDRIHVISTRRTRRKRPGRVGAEEHPVQGRVFQQPVDAPKPKATVRPIRGQVDQDVHPIAKARSERLPASVRNSAGDVTDAHLSRRNRHLVTRLSTAVLRHSTPNVQDHPRRHGIRWTRCLNAVAIHSIPGNYSRKT